MCTLWKSSHLFGCLEVLLLGGANTILSILLVVAVAKLIAISLLKKNHEPPLLVPIFLVLYQTYKAHYRAFVIVKGYLNSVPSTLELVDLNNTGFMERLICSLLATPSSS